jgi:hypothetical protein
LEFPRELLAVAMVQPQRCLIFVTFSMVNAAYTLIEPSGGENMSTVCTHWFDRVITNMLFAIDQWDPTDQEVLEQCAEHGFGTAAQSAPNGRCALPAMAMPAPGMQT